MGAVRIKENWHPSPSDVPNGGTGGRNVLTGYFKSSGEGTYRLYPCHNPIRSFANAETLWSCFGFRTDKNVAKDFLKWLCYVSPWSKTGVVPNELEFDFMFEQGFVFGKLDKTPANLLHSFLIAARTPNEWPDFITAWHRLVFSEDVEPNLAFLFLTCFCPLDSGPSNNNCSFSSDRTSVLAFTDKYDWPLDTARMDEQYVRNFLEGKTVGLSGNFFFPTASTQPINTLWGSVQSKNTYVGLLKDTYEEEFSTPELVTRKFNSDSSSPSRRVFTYKAALEIVRREQKRLSVR